MIRITSASLPMRGGMKQGAEVTSVANDQRLHTSRHFECTAGLGRDSKTKALSDFFNSILLLISILSSDDTGAVSQSSGRTKEWISNAARAANSQL
jgi:hypothetical protein